MLIRHEVPGDWAGVREVNVAAFNRPAEADVVDVLRGKVEPLISLVAEHEDTIVGHILFSPVSLADHPSLRIMGLGPMAVMPAYQRMGIGSQLVPAGLESCKQLGAGAVVVLGRPAYYPRFGFSPSLAFGIGCEYDVPANVFMVAELHPGYLLAASGTIKYHPAFGDV